MRFLTSAKSGAARSWAVGSTLATTPPERYVSLLITISRARRVLAQRLPDALLRAFDNLHLCLSACRDA